ncbi:hypothetical protein [Pseudobacteriovorax antillogorgiicola]|uniref:Uncharacterized protein n=2 Tax=Pseudobacteriovorax antillogorgiicola TaxID=1513793 RepID=A0A1Y6CRW1_9BACT|nr:hypothetical protein [Pseudobacteriovorax antillogorgiicola]TCS46404.1 hypothetical protein EDD56_12468 [Pseudobacteriovorax antillogorgiicola]SMF68830.1 hypothetical protein SAMN06296036_12468 [Pseudobacteriovorax antillogorgiicola]
MKKQLIHLLKDEVIPDLKDHEFAQVSADYANNQAEEIYDFYERIVNHTDCESLLYEELRSRYGDNLQHPEPMIRKMMSVLESHPPQRLAA